MNVKLVIWSINNFSSQVDTQKVHILFSAELKPCGYYLELMWQVDLCYTGQAIIGVKVPNSSHVASSTEE